jgi:hypothetical protein
VQKPGEGGFRTSLRSLSSGSPKPGVSSPLAGGATPGPLELEPPGPPPGVWGVPLDAAVPEARPPAAAPVPEPDPAPSAVALGAWGVPLDAAPAVGPEAVEAAVGPGEADREEQTGQLQGGGEGVEGAAVGAAAGVAAPVPRAVLPPPPPPPPIVTRDVSSQPPPPVT